MSERTERRSLLGQMGVFLDLIRFEHTIFALPFAYSGMLLAAGGSPTLSQFFWITVAMAAARTAAMAFNRWADRHLDARNPRTADRPIQRGSIGAGLVLLLALVSLAILALAAYQLNPLCFMLWPGAFLLLAGYSYTKRFTWMCHYVLGLTDALAPMGAWVAVTGTILQPSDLPGWLLSAGVMVWIAGFDLLYALQDIEVDRREGLYSIPARFGVRRSLWIARFSHAGAVALFAAAAWSARLQWPFWPALAAVCLLFVWEHRLVRPHDLTRIDVAFFNVNSYISLTLFAGILAGVYWP
ncbi:MAG TPA: UbiA-like polyprenyltransferase [Acidobacteriota bacterium]|nr:UbiA-like polyprenyltransferase [Acidobacteriota bacterium]